MKTRFAPAAFAALLVFLGLAPALHAQFGLDKIKQGMDKVKSTTQQVGDTTKKVTDTAKEAAKIAKGVMGIGPEEERLIGESVAVEIIGRYGGVWRDEAATRRVNLLGQALAYYSSRPALTWKFAVLDSPSVNGFSAPGGFVFITRGLYDKAGDNEDALAAILAHEIIHITERHALKIIARGEFFSGATTLAVRHNSDAAVLQSELRQFDTGINDIVKAVLEKGLDPKTEYAADKGGRGLATTVGYAPGALRQVLVQLQQDKSDPKTTFSTHPSIADRLKNLPEEKKP